jgi:regulator of protease activity HflC (stomatin/prohibitin superfamily)
MLAFRTLLLISGAALLLAAASMLLFDYYSRWKLRRDHPDATPDPFRWKSAGRVAALAIAPLLAGFAIVVVPGGMAGIKVSQLSGVVPGTLYPGTHAVLPLVQNVELYDARDRVHNTVAVESKKPVELLQVHTREGLSVGLALSVRYRLDLRKLDSIHTNLPQPIDDQVVAPVVASAFRDAAPAYMVRELYSTRREEVRRQCAAIITNKLAADGLIVKEVLIRDLALPKEYARGLEGLLLKEQENERLNFEVEIKQKLVRTAELEAEAEKMRQIKQAEADAQTTVLKAKADADAMQHTLPLKEKQIEQTRLEAEARKEATVKNAEAMAQAKVIDSRAELERGKLMADSDANRIRVLAAADSERLKIEAAALRDSPLLINKIVAERLSDKVQIMMVPMDGKFFFTNDVLKSAAVTAQAAHSGAGQ